MISVKVIDIYISLSLFFIICICIGGAVVNYVWRRRFERKVAQEVVRGVMEGNEKRENLILVLTKRAEHYEKESDDWHKKAVVALKIANRLKIDTTETANMPSEKLEELLASERLGS